MSIVKTIALSFGLVIIGSMVLANAIAGPSDNQKVGEQIDWQVISSGGTTGNSNSYELSGTTGQVTVGFGSSADYQVGHGYWNMFFGNVLSCCQIRADINHDGTGPDIADLVYLVSYMFQSGIKPPCEEPVDGGYFPEADINGDLTGPDIADLVYLVTYMFQNGPAPVPCQ